RKIGSAWTDAHRTPHHLAAIRQGNSIALSHAPTTITRGMCHAHRNAAA
ncbi:uncharacterized protein METZ01_LOCUS389385, partial [marine metagenome]